ncbi:MAG: hypothetical protein H6Q58_1702 [Firmicutes bacterium]|nr:hypothetical protein [Bacillota bacterium]
MTIFDNEYIRIIISSGVIYLFIIAAIRLFGKKQISQLSVIDLVFILLISNSVQNAMVGLNSTLAGGLVAAGTLFIMNFIFKQLLYRFPKLGNLIQGKKMILIYKGKLNKDNIEEAKLTIDEIMELLRKHGISNIRDVRMMMLEMDGNISVISGEIRSKKGEKR